MVEELKVVAEILSKVSGDALTGVIAFLVYSYVKPVTVWLIGGVSAYKCLGLFTRPPEKVDVVKIEDFKE